MHFRVLGPLEVDAGDGPIPLGGPKQRAVLASLLVRANQVVPADILIDDVWGEETPEKARHILQTYVSNLRRTLGDERLQGRPPGYLLVVDRSELDALRFDGLMADAKRALPIDPNVTIATLDDALALWRGPALADLRDQPSIVAEAARLDELRVQAQEERIEGLLATGAHARALGELEPLLARHPLRESLWALEMLASYRAGRQADALNAFGRARELLADELGIDPSPELAKLHERILKQDPGLELRGEPLRGYRLLERIGTGSTGVVFRGVQPRVGRDVAVKVFHEQVATDAAFVGAFERRAQIVAALEHPHIVPIHDYWREPGRAYVVSRYMRGGSLRAIRDRGGSVGREQALGILADVGSALGFAHRQGVAHGGVTPSTILFDGEGHAYLADFRIGDVTDLDVPTDLIDLRRLARDLLGNQTPASLLHVLDGVGDADEVADAARRSLEPRTEVPSLRSDRNPYKGLRPFTEADASDFFGRAELTDRLVARLNEPVPGARFLAIVGPSGCGKSSAVRAGLLPALRGGALSTATPLVVADMFPGSHPIDELEGSLLRVAVRPPSRLGELLNDSSRGLLEAADLVLPDDAELLLVVDQLEELFTLSADEREREHVLESLRVASVDPASRLRIVGTLRADLFDRPLMYPRFGELLGRRNEVVPPLTPDELEQAIRRPAEREGMRLEPGLVAEMIADVAHQPGGLPLLQYALTELFERRDGDSLTLAAYREIDGVTGALSARADRLYASADAEQRRAIEQVFLRMVTLGEGRLDTRRRVTVRELDGLDVSDAAVAGVLESYGRHRLLTFDREPATREPTAEVAHEALLHAWGRLSSWIDEAREDIRQDQRLVRAAAEWQGSGGDPSFLMTGSRLEQVDAWAAATSLSIGRNERTYLKASTDQRDRARADEGARRARERRVERRSVRRLRALVGVFAVAALVAGVLTVIATNQMGRAEREGSRADRQERVARSTALAGAAVLNLDADPELSVLLAMEAVDETRSFDGTVLPEAEDALHRAIAASRVVATLSGVGGPVAWGAGGTLAVLDPRAPELIEIRAPGDMEDVVRTFDARGAVTDLAFDTRGRTLAATTTTGSLLAWDTSSGQKILEIDGRGPASGTSFDRSGRLLAAAWRREGAVRVLDVTGREMASTLRLEGAFDTSLDPSGRRVAVSADRAVSVLDVRTGARVLDPLVPSSGNSLSYDAKDVEWSPDGRRIATASAFLDVWDAETGESLVARFAGVDSVVWAPDARRLITGSTSDGTVRVWNVGGFDPVGELTLSAMETRRGIGANGIAVAPDGYLAAAASDDGSAIKVWDIGLGGDAEWANLPTFGYYGDVAFLPDGRLVGPAPNGQAAVLDPRRQVRERLVGPPTDFEQAFDVTSDGLSIAFAYSDTVTAWDLESGARLFSRGFDRFVNRVDWSPDGRFLAVPEESGDRVTILDRSGRIVTILPQPGSAAGARFSDDGRLLAVTHYDRVTVWDWQSGSVVRSFPARGWDVAWSRTGTIASFGGEASSPEVWDVRSGTRTLVFREHAGETLVAAFAPDGSIVATGGQDDAVRLFDASTGEPGLVLEGHPAGIRGLAFSADGSMLASHSPTEIRVWALDIDDLLAIARENVTRAMTDQECRRYLDDAACPSD